jgi:hypothetical protein
MMKYIVSTCDCCGKRFEGDGTDTILLAVGGNTLDFCCFLCLIAWVNKASDAAK